MPPCLRAALGPSAGKARTSETLRISFPDGGAGGRGGGAGRAGFSGPTPPGLASGAERLGSCVLVRSEVTQQRNWAISASGRRLHASLYGAATKRSGLDNTALVSHGAADGPER